VIQFDFLLQLDDPGEDDCVLSGNTDCAAPQEVGDTFEQYEENVTCLKI
jgi:hypothetical protein